MVDYIPELDYEARDYKPFKGPPEDVCASCIKYYKKLYEEGLVDTPRPPNCRLSSSRTIKKLDPKSFSSEEEYFDALAALHPVFWAQKELNWTPRWFQDWFLDCTAQFKVMRSGRRAGKTEGLSVYSIYRAVTEANFPIIVITPYEPQLAHIFSILKGFIFSNQALSDSVRRSTENPHRLEFHNGSYILGFTGGTKSGARSDKIRGQDAKLIVMDEVAYLSTQELNPVTAILASHPDCELIASSTPTEAHDTFWQYWHNKRLGFKEFHVISQESPSWTEKTEQFFRSTFTIGEYRREILAEPGYGANSVYRGTDIDRALSDYTYSDCSFTEGRPCAIGVDWNKHAGAHIVVVEWTGSHFKMVDKRIVNPDDYKQLSAVEAVLKMWEKWPKAHIFPDEGYGETQIEILKKASLSNKYKLLSNRIHPVVMGSQLEIRDPITGLMEKKPAKAFMINITVLQLEEGRILIPASEDALPVEGAGDKRNWGLVRQMRNFRVDHYTNSGQPVYTDEGDHTLIAWALAVFGLVWHNSDIVRRAGDPRILKTANSNKHIKRDIVRKIAATKMNRELDLRHYGSLRGYTQRRQFLRRDQGLKRREF